MPMVETSVAVATPSTTAARITKGSATAGSAISAELADLAPGDSARTWLRSSRAVAPPDHDAERQAEHHAPAAGRR